MTEKDIQAALYDYRTVMAPFPLMVPNVYLYPWESDLLYISRAGYVTEYEIKLSRADYRRDFKKEHKHFILKNGTERRPKYFYYVCPDGLIQPEEIPAIAGLFYIRPRPRRNEWTPDWYVSPGLYAAEIVKAPAARSQAITEREMMGVMAKGAQQFWKLLRKVNRETGYAEKMEE